MLEVSGVLIRCSAGPAAWCDLPRRCSAPGAGRAPNSIPAGPQVRQRHASRLAHSRIAAGQGHIGQVEAPLVAAIAAQQHFAAPDGAIRAVAGAVKAQPDDRLAAVPAVIGQAGGQVGMVMLHLDQGQILFVGALLGVAGGQVIGMQVAGDPLWLDAEQPLDNGAMPSSNERSVS